MRRFFIGFLCLLAAGGLTLAGLTWWVGRPGRSTGVERWVAGQLERVAQSYLQPRLSYEDVNYVWPRTVILRKLKLTAEEGNGPPFVIASVEKATLELAEVPRLGEPIAIQTLTLLRPEIRLIGASASDSRLIGFSRLLKPREAAQKARQAAERTRVEDLFAIRGLNIEDGKVVYDPRRQESGAMELDHIQGRLGVMPTGDGWYSIKTAMNRAPVSQLRLEGAVNLNTLETKIDQLVLKTQAGRAHDATLPPALQQLLKAHEVEGQLEISLNGTLPLPHWRKGAVLGEVNLTRGRLAVGQNKVLVEQLQTQIHMADSVLFVPRLEIHAWGGTLRGSGDCQLGDDGTAAADLTLENVQLEETLRTTNRQKRSGLLSGHVQWAGLLRKAAESSQGEGTLTVRQGKLIDLPVISDLQAAMRVVGLASLKPSDQAQIKFTFAGDHIEFKQINISTDTMAVRGDGTMGFNGVLDLKLNGGPLEKVQSELGAVGKLLGGVTDQLGRYHVQGTVREPTVRIVVGPDL